MESDVSILQLKSSTCAIPRNDGRVRLIVIIIITIKYLLTFSNPFLCARCGSQDFDIHFLISSSPRDDARIIIILNIQMKKLRLGEVNSLPEVTQIISASIKSLTQVSHSDPRDTLSKQKGVYRVGWWGRRMKGEGFCLFHSCLELCWHSCDYVERNKCIYMEIPKMDCIYHYFLPHG